MASTGTTVVTAVKPVAAKRGRPRKSRPAPDIMIMPSSARASVGDAPAGQTRILAQCQGCPWHTAHPIAFRTFIADDATTVKIGQVLVAEHATRHEWWGNWKVLAIGSDGKVTGAIPDGLPSQTIWHVTAAPQPEKEAAGS